jgi:hypothetical protein
MMSSQTEECMICIEEIHDDFDSCTQCNQSFHCDCIVEWSMTSQRFRLHAPTGKDLYVDDTDHI